MVHCRYFGHLVVRRLRCHCGAVPLVQTLVTKMLMAGVSLQGGCGDAVGYVVFYHCSCDVVVNTRIQVDGDRDHGLSKYVGTHATVQNAGTGGSHSHVWG